jgi:uncharacterized protein
MASPSNISMRNTSSTNRASTNPARVSGRSAPRHPLGTSAIPRLILVTLAFLFTAALFAAAQTPDQIKPTGYVMDVAGVLSPQASQQLTALCTELQQKTQVQIAVVTIKSLGGRAIEDYSIDLATHLGVGPKSSAKGVLILLAVNDHRYRIEVGYGLGDILNDAKVGDIGREAVPYLRQNNYDAAVLLMTRRVADVIAADRGVTLSGAPPPEPALRPVNQAPSGFPVIFLGLFVVFIIFAIINAIRRAGRSGVYRRGGGSGWWIGPMIGGMGGGGFGGGGFGGGGGGGGFGGFGGGGFGGGGASGSW